MKRGWLGVGILVFFVVFGLWSTCAVDSIYAPIAAQLKDAADLALSGDLDAGAALAKEAQQSWHHYWRKTAALSNHQPMDEIDALFSQLEVFADCGSKNHFAAGCVQLSALVDACAEAHRLTWWNLL